MAIQVVTGVVCLMGSAWCSESRFPLFYHALLYRDDFLAQTLRDLPSAGLAVQGTYVSVCPTNCLEINLGIAG